VNKNLTIRILIVCVCLLAGTGLIARNSGLAVTPLRDSLSDLPVVLGEWNGQKMQDYSDDTLAMLRVDDYINRSYYKHNKESLGLYIGYHHAGGFHSPLNCLPGAGWIPVITERINIPVRTSLENSEIVSININRLTIMKGIDKQVVLYWYQGCGRIIASEYAGLLYGMVDKMRRGRTDAALVRIISPVESLEPEAKKAAEKRAAEFAELIFPWLSRYIPN
jgi:EpsI family protein